MGAKQIKVKIKGSPKQAKPLLIQRPSWADMLKNYPGINVPTEVLYKQISKALLLDYQTNLNTPYANTCAFRMSRGLSLSGFKLPLSDLKYREKGVESGVLVGEDKNNYWFRVKELSPFLADNFGTPQLDKTLSKAAVGERKIAMTEGEMDEFKNKKGIIIFNVSGWGDASGHFTLWDGTNLSYVGMSVTDQLHNNVYSNLYYFHLKEDRLNVSTNIKFVVQTDRIRLWELK